MLICLVPQLKGLLLGGWPLHWIHLSLREGNSDVIFFEAAPDHLAKIAFDLKSFEWISYPEKNFVVDGRVSKAGCESCWCWLGQNLFMLFGEFNKNLDDSPRFMVVCSPDINGAAS